jgi:hypothetical protein
MCYITEVLPHHKPAGKPIYSQPLEAPFENAILFMVQGRATVRVKIARLHFDVQFEDCNHPPEKLVLEAVKALREFEATQ